MAVPMEKQLSDLIYETLRQKCVVEGYTPDIAQIPNIDSEDLDLADAAFEEYDTQLKAIAASKGFAIHVLGFSSNQYKDEKKVCRIVVDINQFLPSELGNDTTPTYKRHEVEDNIYYTKSISPTQLADLTFTIYAIGYRSEHIITMNKIIMSCLPKRGYIKPIDEQTLLPYNNFFVRLNDKGNTPYLPLGIMERYLIYQIMDVNEEEDTPIPGQTPAIKEINLEVIPEDPTASS